MSTFTLSVDFIPWHSLFKFPTWEKIVPYVKGSFGDNELTLISKNKFLIYLKDFYDDCWGGLSNEELVEITNAVFKLTFSTCNMFAVENRGVGQ